MERIKHYFLEIILVLLCVFFVVTVQIFFRESPSNILTVVFLDVGQGDSIFIESPTKNRMIIDGGPNAALITELGDVLPWYSRWIDVLLVTHPDSDHFAGFIDLLKRYEVGGLVESSVLSDSKIYTQFTQAIDTQEVPRVDAVRGMTIDIGGGAYVEILFPDRDVSKMDTNDASIVAKLIYGSTTVLLTGDSPKSIENYLIERDGKLLQSDILKVGHHGSKTSTSESFVPIVAPTYAIISAGKDNRYGHPHTEVVELLKKNTVEIITTAVEGTIIFQSNGKEFIRK